MKNIFKGIYDFFSPKMICGKELIEKEMSEKYGEDWLDQCIDSLKDPEVREQLKKDLKL
jgi:hypothetical protein